MNINATITIITRNRSKSLDKCLACLERMTDTPSRVLVIDNASKDNTRKIVDKYRKKDLIKIDYFLEKKIGVVSARNLGLMKNKTKWMAFLDDDCFVDQNWLSAGWNCAKLYKVQFIQGETKLTFGENYWNVINHFFEKYHRNNCQTATNGVDGRVLDTKNCLVDTEFVKKKGLKFVNQKIVDRWNRGEDYVFGLALNKVGGKGVVCQKMSVKHRDKPVGFGEFVKLMFVSRKIFFLNQTSVLRNERRVGFFDFCKKEVTKIKMTKLKKTVVLILVIVSILSIKIMDVVVALENTLSPNKGGCE